ncbi:MAG: molybdopterin-dependent oxidoreductase [Chloroflexi bacterium]|nr:molybdopterin-dependent oxidoreductase [Chloroflexota bacterium]
MSDEIKVGDVFPWELSRRQFLGLSATAAGALALGTLPRGSSPAAPACDAHMPPVKFDREVYTLCEQCVWRCGLRAKVLDGKVYKLDGNPHHPHSNGMLCPRGQAGIAALYDPDRLQFPMIRAGDRGSGLWKRVTWAEALDYTAQKMQALKEQYGAESMIFSSTHNLAQTQFENLLRAYGSPNYGTQRSQCFNAMIIANLLTFGMQEPDRDYSAAKYIIYAGRNLAEAISNSETQAMIEALARGARVVLLDPRFTKSASKATEWLPIRPGTDLAFFLAMLNVLIAEGLYDKDFVGQHTLGFDEVAQAIKPYTPEWAASKTEIPAATIRRIAREFALAAPHAFVHNNWRTSNFVNSFQAERAMAVVNAISGNWQQPGGLFPSAGESGVALGSIPQPAYPRVTALRLDGVPWKFPLVPLEIGVFQEVRDAILAEKPYPARAWLVYRQNPIAALPERRKTLQAFGKLDFVVTIDTTMNDTAWFGDVVLPEASYLERYDPLAVVGDAVFIRQPAVPAIGESKSGLWIFKELGTRLGLKDYFQYQDEEDYLRQQLKPLGITLEELKTKGHYRPPASADANAELKFDTPSGKIELSSASLAKANYPAVPVWEEPPAPLADQFYLLTGKVAQHTQCSTQNNRLLHELFPRNTVWIHTTPAAERGIKDGDWVWVESQAGKVKIHATVTEGIRPDCVYMTPGFGHLSKGTRTSYGEGVSDSDLHVTFTDPVSGGQALSQTFVKVYNS